MIFSDRHIGPNKKEIRKMLNALGVNMEELICETIPNNILLKNELKLDKAISGTNSTFNELYQKKINFSRTHWLGLPPINNACRNSRNILENPGWYTAYTLPS